MTFTGWLGGALVVIFTIWLGISVFKFAMKMGEFNWWDAVKGLAIMIGVWLLLTQQESPVQIVKLWDSGYTDLKSGVETSDTASDIIKVFGQDPQAFGVNPSVGSNTTITTGPDTGSGNPVVTVIQPTQQAVVVPNTAAFPYRMTIPADDQVTIRGADGFTFTADLKATHELCITSWVDTVWADGCGQLEGYDVTVESWMNVPSAQVAQVVAPQVVAPTQAVDKAEYNRAMGACWQTWAGAYLYGTDQNWGQNALPAGPFGPWSLTGPGELGSWAGKADEQWKLSNPILGINDYPVNGYVGRSFPGADDSGTTTVYGSNPNIATECLALAP